MVTREPEWDDDTRDQASGFTEYQSGICGCGCGLPAVEAHDSQRAFEVHTTTCYARRALDKVRRDSEAAHKNDTEGIWSSGLFFYAQTGAVIATSDQSAPIQAPGTPRMSRIERIRKGLT